MVFVCGFFFWPFFLAFFFGFFFLAFFSLLCGCPPGIRHCTLDALGSVPLRTVVCAFHFLPFWSLRRDFPQKPLPRTPHSHSPLSLPPSPAPRPPAKHQSTALAGWLAGWLTGLLACWLAGWTDQGGEKEPAPARRKSAAAHVFDGLCLRSAVYGTVAYGTYRGSTRCSPPTAALGLAGKDAADASETCE